MQTVTHVAPPDLIPAGGILEAERMVRKYGARLRAWQDVIKAHKAVDRANVALTKAQERARFHG